MRGHIQRAGVNLVSKRTTTINGFEATVTSETMTLVYRKLGKPSGDAIVTPETTEIDGYRNPYRMLPVDAPDGAVACIVHYRYAKYMLRSVMVERSGAYLIHHHYLRESGKWRKMRRVVENNMY
jgi:hypothetical protein